MEPVYRVTVDDLALLALDREREQERRAAVRQARLERVGRGLGRVLECLLIGILALFAPSLALAWIVFRAFRFEATIRRSDRLH